jgi:hypothetical protein
MFKLFGGKKKDKGFYLELDESKGSKPAAPEAPATAPEATAVVEEKPEPVKAPAAKKTSKKSAKKANAAPAAKAPEPVAASTPSAATNGGKNEPQVVNFATDYLVVQTMSRRRPGPSLNSFKEMASQMKMPKTKA